MPRTTRILTLVSIFTLFSVGVHGALLFMVLQAEREITTLETAAFEKTSEDAQQRSLAQELSDTEAERARLDAYFVSEGDVVAFIELLEHIGRTSGTALAITTVEEGGQQFAERLPSLRVQFVVRGAWRDVFHFVSLVDALPFVVSVERAGLEAQRAGDAEVWRGVFRLAVALRQ